MPPQFCLPANLRLWWMLFCLFVDTCVGVCEPDPLAAVPSVFSEAGRCGWLRERHSASAIPPSLCVNFRTSGPFNVCILLVLRRKRGTVGTSSKLHKCHAVRGGLKLLRVCLNRVSPALKVATFIDLLIHIHGFADDWGKAKSLFYLSAGSFPLFASEGVENWLSQFTSSPAPLPPYPPR